MSKPPKKEKPRTALNIAAPTAIQEAAKDAISPAREERQPEPTTTARSPERNSPRAPARAPDRMWNNLKGVKDPDFVDLNFKVRLELRTEFKQVAAAWNMSNKELMLSCYNLFIERYGKTPREAEKKFMDGLIDTPEPPVPTESSSPDKVPAEDDIQK